MIIHSVLYNQMNAATVFGEMSVLTLDLLGTRLCCILYTVHYIQFIMFIVLSSEMLNNINNIHIIQYQCIGSLLFIKITSRSVGSISSHVRQTDQYMPQISLFPTFLDSLSSTSMSHWPHLIFLLAVRSLYVMVNSLYINIFNAVYITTMVTKPQRYHNHNGFITINNGYITIMVI